MEAESPRWYARPKAVAIGAGVLLIGAAALAYSLFGVRSPQQSPDSAATAPAYVGTPECAGCHKEAYQAWKDSDHALALQHADAQSVQANFENSRFTYAGITSTFFQRDGKFFVNTDGPDGKLRDYEIKYTFGVKPLQQYLIELPGGRYQALSIAWDSRPKEQGGQRWFHLYPRERISHQDELHWTRPAHNWNFMCADCHSTDLRKNYDAATDSFKTRWAEISVGCEACHGPGSDHVSWAKSQSPPLQKGGKGGFASAEKIPLNLSLRQSSGHAFAEGEGRQRNASDKGLTVRLDERRGVTWNLNRTTDHAARSQARITEREIEVCAQCHARRGQIAEGYVPGKPFLDHYRPALLTPPLYHLDGQQRDEVYTWGSFLQSKMYATGVTCSDCHEPHSGRLRAQGNALCASCHSSGKYDAPSIITERTARAQHASPATCRRPPT